MPAKAFPLLSQYAFFTPFHNYCSIFFFPHHIRNSIHTNLNTPKACNCPEQAQTRTDVGATAQSANCVQRESQQDMNIFRFLNDTREGFKTCPPTQGCF